MVREVNFFQEMRLYKNNGHDKLAGSFIPDTKITNPLWLNPDTYQNDLFRIREFLLDDQAVKALLIKLEEQLVAHIKNSSSYESLRLQFGNAKPNKHFKILSSLLYAWAVDNGFASPATLDDNVSDKQFAKILMDKILFKDKNFGDREHGEWTHFIQWWCIVEANKQSKFLDHDPAEIYSWLGMQDPNIWFSIFEVLEDDNTLRGPSSIGASVVAFSQFLRSDEGNMLVPNLSELLTMRYNRRIEKCAGMSI